MSTDWITIGRIRKPHGLKGMLRADLLTDVTDRFDGLEVVWVELADGQRERFIIAGYQMERSTILLRFESVDTPEAGDRLRGGYIQVPLDNKASLNSGQFYVSDLVGSRVVSEDGHDIGKIREVLDMPANDVFVVDTPDGEVLIPAIQDVVIHLDTENRKVVVRPLPGLLN